jgi:hypothetical protein
MKPRDHQAGTAPVPAKITKADDSSTTGMPWLRTWRSVYWFVLGSFVIWVGLLYLLGVVFS